MPNQHVIPHTKAPALFRVGAFVGGQFSMKPTNHDGYCQRASLFGRSADAIIIPRKNGKNGQKTAKKRPTSYFYLRNIAFSFVRMPKMSRAIFCVTS